MLLLVLAYISSCYLSFLVVVHAVGTMDELIPDRQTREQQADEVGTTLYKHNWERILSALSTTDPNFAQFVKEIPYGSVYPRKALDLPSREIAAITALTTLNLKSQLKSHIIAALNVGITEEQIRELFLHLAMYIGFPVALDGLRVAEEVFNKRST